MNSRDGTGKPGPKGGKILGCLTENLARNPGSGTNGSAVRRGSKRPVPKGRLNLAQHEVLGLQSQPEECFTGGSQHFVLG